VTARKTPPRPKKAPAGKAKPSAGQAKDDSAGGLPSRERVLAFISETEGNIGKREIARAFNIKGSDRIPLKRMLRELEAEGLLEKDGGKKLRRPGELPAVTVLEVTHTDMDGDLIAKPLNWSGEEPAPLIVIVPEKRRGKRYAGDAPTGVGDRVLARIAQNTDEPDTYPYEARVIKRVGKGAERVLGVFKADARGGRILPVDKKTRHEFEVGRGDAGDAGDGDLVMGETIPGKQHGRPRARVIEVLGNRDDPRVVSLIAIHAHGIPDAFPEEVVKSAARMRHRGLKGREDLRDIPLVTIDPADARDHDDAVWAMPDDNPKNEGGHIVIVAIADVAAYVRPGEPMDEEAKKRGNSTYFPDRVVPMLPERISNDLCSLREKEDRACIAVRMTFDRHGTKIGHEFIRGLMKSAASLTYRQMQEAIDGKPDDKTGPLLDTVLQPLWNAYQTMLKGREQRGPLELDLPEYRIGFDDNGKVVQVKEYERFESMRLIEECMIQANVCAAESVEDKRKRVIYRVHDGPSRERIMALAEFLDTLDISFSKGEVVRPQNFNRILKQVHDTEHDRMVSEVILRSQAQAIYSPDNIGHFGLNLRRYAHFTSPIRRYADLTVHRALIASLNLGPDVKKDGQPEEEERGLEEIATHISMTERRSMMAERDSKDRFIAQYLESRIGAEFKGHISGVTRFGLFVKLDDNGADGIVPIATLGAEYFHHDEVGHALVGERSRTTYRLGEAVRVKLAEAAPITGGMRFELLDGGSTGGSTGRRNASGRGRPGTSRRRGPQKSGAKPKGKRKTGSPGKGRRR
jgi:ribonuclease R